MNRELMDAYNYQLEKINQDEAAGLISEEQAAEFRELLMDELEEAQFSESDVEDEVIADFSAGNSLGATLLEVGEQLGYNDPEEYLLDLSDELGIDPEEAYAMIVTDEEPDEEVAYSVLDALGLLEDEELDIEDEYEEEEEYEEEPEIEESSYSAYDPRVDELEAQVAEFQAANALKDVLHKLDVQAQNLVENGDLPPVAYDILFGSFDTEEDRVAAFSQVAESNGNNLNEELVKIQGALELFERMGLGELGLFNQMIEEEVMSNFSAQEELSEDEAALIAGTSAYIRSQRG